MYGVGLNPIYIAREEERAAKKEASGQAALEREEAAKADAVGKIFEVASLAAAAEGDDDDDELMDENQIVGVVQATAPFKQGAGFDVLSSEGPSSKGPTRRKP